MNNLRPSDRKVLAAMPHNLLATSGRALRTYLNASVPWWAFWRRWSAAAVYASLARLQEAGAVEAIAEDYTLCGIPLRRFLYVRRRAT